MKQLDPKAIWLFFLSSLVGWITLCIFIGFIAGPALMITLIDGSYDPEAVSWIANFILNRGGFLIFFVILALIWAFIWAKLSYKYYKYEISEKGFCKEYGVIWKSYVTIPYDRIQNVDIYRGVVARFLGLSDLHIQTAGSGAAFGEGRLPGLSREVAEQLRDEVLDRSRHSRSGQGL